MMEESPVADSQSTTKGFSRRLGEIKKREEWMEMERHRHGRGEYTESKQAFYKYNRKLEEAGKGSG